MKLLLISNGKNPNDTYLNHCKNEIKDHLKECKHIVFVPYAGVSISNTDYEEKVNNALKDVGVRVTSVVGHKDPKTLITECDGIIVGGGNTFRLLDMMYGKNIVTLIRDRVCSGMPYVGWSAGSNIASPTISTTNDMPIVCPMSFNSLNLVGFQINPHYTEETLTNHGGETRKDRLDEFMVINDKVKVLGLSEGAMLLVKGPHIFYKGKKESKVFLNREEIAIIEPSAEFKELKGIL